MKCYTVNKDQGIAFSWAWDATKFVPLNWTLARNNFTWKHETTHTTRSFAIEKKRNCKSLESSMVTGSPIYLRNIQMYLRNVFCFSGHENTWHYSKLDNASTGDSINKKNCDEKWLAVVNKFHLCEQTWVYF